VPEFSSFDQRHYRTVGAREGYGAWQPTYEDTVEDVMDLALLDALAEVRWSEVGAAADLGCGTGRTAAWLAAKGVPAIDGVDVTPEMLDAARARGQHRRLVEADVRATTLPTDSYDLVICSLVDEHLPTLDPLYREARRLLRATGAFVLVGFHPFFIMGAGMPTHFDGPDGHPVAIETHVHLPSAHVAAAAEAGFVAAELREGVVDDEWIRRKPSLAARRDWPISFAWVWRVAPARA
jgi:SAM-dependent methyltransferase